MALHFLLFALLDDAEDDAADEPLAGAFFVAFGAELAETAEELVVDADLLEAGTLETLVGGAAITSSPAALPPLLAPPLISC